MSKPEEASQGLVVGYLSRLRHPWLLALALLAFGVDLFVPDVLPFVDELVLGAIAATLAALRKRRKDENAEDADPSPEQTD